MKLGKAWDEASCEGRHWVDGLACTAVGLITNCIYSRELRRLTYVAGEYGVYKRYTSHWRKSSSIFKRET